MRFAIVGVVGFIFDSGIFLMLFPQFNAFISRIISFGVAVIVTFLLNRRFTFGVRKKITISRLQEEGLIFIGYLSGQALGFSTNIVIFSAMMMFIDWAQSYPLVPLAISSIVALFLNFFLAGLIFKHA